MRRSGNRKELIWIETNTEKKVGKFLLGKISILISFSPPVRILPDSELLQGNHAKENKTLVTFLTTGNLSGLPC